VLTAALLVSIAGADTSLSVGSSRMAGMAGAGLALPFDVAVNGQFNPALYARAKKKIDFGGGLGYYLQGVSYSGLNNYFTNIGSGGTSSSDALSIAQNLGGHSVEIGAHGDIALAFGRAVLSFNGGADVTSDPNAALENFVNSGESSIPSGTPQDDVYGYGFSSVNLGYGQPFDTKCGQFALGGQIRFIKSYYSHYFANVTANEEELSGTLPFTWNSGHADEMNGADTLSATGTGVDVGFLYSTPDDMNHVGLSVLNLVEPKVGFMESLPDQLQGTDSALNSADLNPFRRTVNVGWGGTVAQHLTLAADEVDLGNDAGQESFRAGADYSFGHGFGLRAGYDARDKFAIGASIFGLNVAYSTKDPLSLSYMLHF
jgi:hypothetical protein